MTQRKHALAIERTYDAEYVRDLARQAYEAHRALADAEPPRFPPPIAPSRASVRPIPQRCRRVPIAPPGYDRVLAECRTDTRHGYRRAGAAVVNALPKIGENLSTTRRREQLRAAVTAGDARAVVRWLVRHAPWLVGGVPYERRYASFLRGVAAALAATTWSLDPSTETHKRSETPFWVGAALERLE